MTRLRRLATFTVLAVTAVSVAGCSSSNPSPGSESADSGSAAEDSVLGHVHGVGVDPADGTLYVASHFGVFRVTDGEPKRVADRWQDTMGFAVVGPGHFLGSGHPDMREDLPTSLGLIESTDGAETWEPVSLLGDADLHAIEPVGDRIYGYDSHSGALIVTTDRKNWNIITKAPLLDLAANPSEPGTILATTDRGVLVRSVDGRQPTPVSGAATLTAIDWQPDGPLVGVTPDGTVMTSHNGQANWQPAGSLNEPVAALDAAPGRWHAATKTGVYESTDDGATWNRVLTTEG